MNSMRNEGLTPSGAPAISHNGYFVLVDGNLKILDKISENTVELYDLAQDPTEQRNIALSSPAEAKRMKQALRDYMASIREPAAAAPPRAAHAP